MECSISMVASSACMYSVGQIMMPFIFTVTLAYVEKFQ